MLRRSSAASGRQGFSFCTASVMVCSTASAAFCASRRTPDCRGAASALPCRLRPCRGRASAKRIVPASFFLPSRFSARLACPRLRKKNFSFLPSCFRNCKNEIMKYYLAVFPAAGSDGTRRETLTVSIPAFLPLRSFWPAVF